MHDLVRGEACHGLPQQTGIEDVHFPPEETVGRFMRGLMRDIEDFVSLGEESIDYMGPDESGTAGDEDFHYVCGMVVSFRCGAGWRTR
jgi:hypothetical protein